MSVNRRGRGPRKAYLKHTVSKYDANPDSRLKDAIGLNRDINPINALPHRARLWLDTNKHTPTMTEPMKERIESWNKHIKERDNEYKSLLTGKDNPLRAVWICMRSDSLGNEFGCFWFKSLCKISGVEKVSFSFSKKADAMQAFKYNHIVWKPLS